MNFIESIFGVAPDAGNGLWEWAIVAGIIALVSVSAQRRRLRRAPEH